MARLFWCMQSQRLQSQNQTHWTYAMMCSFIIVVTFKGYLTPVMNKLTCFISRGRVSTSVEVDIFVAVLLQITWVSVCQNNQSTMRFDIVIAKIKECNFLPHSIESAIYTNLLKIYTVSCKKTCHSIFVHNFEKCWPILKILSLLYSAVSLPWDLCHISHHTYNVSLHNLVKNIISKIAKF